MDKPHARDMISYTKGRFYKKLVDSGEVGMSVLRKLETHELLSPKEADVYNSALASMLNEQEEPLYGLDFMSKYRPVSTLSAGRRNSTYWDAAIAYCQAADRFSRHVPLSCHPSLVIREKAFYRSFLNRYRIPVDGCSFVLEKPERTVLWRLTSPDGSVVGRPVHWHVVSGKNVTARYSSFTSLEGKKVEMVSIHRLHTNAAFCWFVDGQFCDWKVARDSDDVSTIERWVHSNCIGYMAFDTFRYSDIGRPYKHRDLISPPYNRLDVDPTPNSVFTDADDTVLFLVYDPPVSTVVITDPELYSISLSGPIGKVRITPIPGELK